ncbi:DUF3426 domain-containing protein [Trinickia terrae]
MWAPAADAKIDPALHHDIDTVSGPHVEVPGAIKPETAREPEQETDRAAEAHAAHGAPDSSTESSELREPSFTAWRGPATRPEFEEYASTAASAHAAEPTLPKSAAPWAADPEPHFGTPAAEPSADEPAAAAEPFTAQPAATQSPAEKPFAEPFAAAPADTSARSFVVTREERAPEPSRIVWRILGTLVALVLAVVLVAQLAWWRRETVMVYWPSSQPLFVQVCAQLGCQISPPRDIDGLQVEPSELRQVDGPHRLELRVPLRNRYNIALAYPAMELTLLDEKNNVAIRRVLWPQDYVRPGTPIAAGLPARSTQTMIVRLDTGSAVASNFRVQIFYP